MSPTSKEVLGQEDVKNRVAQGKVNGDTNVKTKSVAQILRENIVTFFNFVFIALAALIFFFVDSHESIVSIMGNFGFMLLIVFNALVGIFQELRAKRTIDKLSLISAPKAIVLRDGEQKEIAIKDIVLDDLTILSSGSQICAVPHMGKALGCAQYYTQCYNHITIPFRPLTFCVLWNIIRVDDSRDSYLLRAIKILTGGRLTQEL